MSEYLQKVKEFFLVDYGRIVAGVLALLFLVCVLGCNDANAATRNITCTPPTERTDGTPMTVAEIANYEWWVDGVMDGTSTDCAYVLDKPDGTYNVQAKTIDTGGRVSVASQPPKSFTLTTADPNPPILQ